LLQFDGWNNDYPRMSIPPSTVSVIPVTNCASGESTLTATLPHINKKKISPSLLRLLGLQKSNQLPAHVHSAINSKCHSRYELRKRGKQIDCRASDVIWEANPSKNKVLCNIIPAESI
jgi:hypothetical protein